MIRVVTLDTFDEKQIARLCKILYQAFAVGSEHSATVKVPSELSEPLEAGKLLELVESVRAYEDDKTLYVTSRKLKERALLPGTAPTHGFPNLAKNRAVISTHGVKNLEDGMKTVAKHALHQLGHLWELHHCLDPRCAMYPTWTPSFLQGEALFCTFCRDKSEQKIRLAKS